MALYGKLPSLLSKMPDDSPNVLLVEDDPDTQANLCDILEIDGNRVAVAGSAKEALERKDWAGLRVVILDRRLPDGNAEELLPELKQLAPQADVIVVTGYADLDGTITALRQGAADYIIKPINADALRASLRRITERHKMQHALHEEHELAERILNTAEAIVLVLDLDGNIVRFNPYMERLSGYTLDEVKGKSWFETFLRHGEQTRIEEVFRQTVDGERTTGTINPIVAKDGTEREIRWSNATLTDEHGDATSVLAIGLDITEFLDAQKKILQSERLAAIGQTMAALAHESRNALQRIQAGIEMVQLELSDDHAARGDLMRIETASDDLHGLMEEVRAFAAPINVDRYQCDLAKLWRRAWEHLAIARKGRDASLQEICDVDLQCTVDGIRFEQVFRNLFENALAACADPVQINVTCSAVRIANQDGIQICVQDNGPGLTPEQRGKVFDAFFTTKSRGTGLGMAIVKRIVEAHDGQIEVGSSEGGAEFVITLPRLAD